MYQGAFLLDPEAGLHLFTALDAIMAPRRSVRFIDERAQTQAEALVADPRTDQQIEADALTDIVRLAVHADPGKLFGARRPAVRVVVTETTLSGPGGHAFLEGDRQPISRETVDRHLCDTGMIGIKFDRNGHILNLGRTRRLFSEPQRLTIGIRDGGCIFPKCTKPPSACEVHHIIPWKKGGRTDVRDGVLLCQHHHMLLHNNHWRILRRPDQHGNDQYWLKPPPAQDPEQKPIQLQSKSPLMRELLGVK